MEAGLSEDRNQIKKGTRDSEFQFKPTNFKRKTLAYPTLIILFYNIINLGLKIKTKNIYFSFVLCWDNVGAEGDSNL